MSEAGFDIDVTEADARRFAELSGDWNPLHTDPDYAETSTYGRTVLHGAYSAGLVSRLAGMNLPGRECLLHGLRLRFVRPILPPARLRVTGRVTRSSAEAGSVQVTVDDRDTGARYVEGAYEYGFHQLQGSGRAPEIASQAEADSPAAPILVTGATGGLGAAVVRRLGPQALGISRSGGPGLLLVREGAGLAAELGERRISGIVHCGWPTPDNVQLTRLGESAGAAIGHQLARPMEDMVHLARLLTTHGEPGAPLVLVGSTVAEPGRHQWRMPLYSLSKSMMPTLVSILALELGGRGQRCIGVAFDVIDGGINASMSAAARVSHADRAPSGRIASPDEAADQIAWVLSNASTLVSGAMINLSGAALP